MKKQVLLMFTALCSLAAMAQVPSYLPTSGLTSWWPFNGNTNDESGNGNNGTIIGSITFAPDRNNQNNKAILVSTGNDMIATTTSFNNPFPLTISAWFKSNSSTVTNGFVFSFNNGQNAHGGQWDRAVIINNTSVSFYVYNGAQTFVTTTA